MTKLDLWIGSWIELFSNIIQIITFTYWMPNWYIDWAFWITLKRLHKKLEKEKE